METEISATQTLDLGVHPPQLKQRCVSRGRERLEVRQAEHNQVPVLRQDGSTECNPGADASYEHEHQTSSRADREIRHSPTNVVRQLRRVWMTSEADDS